MSRKSFAELAIRLRGSPFSLADRPYLGAAYGAQRANLVLRASRQVEKSTFLVNRMLYDAVQEPGIQILFVCPRWEQALLFSHDRLAATIQGSPALRQLLWPYKRPLPTKNIRLANGSRVTIRAAYDSADGIRGISADELFVDEYQDLAAGELPVVQETLSHAKRPRTILAGTPKMIDNHLEKAFRESTANEWQVRCTKCEQFALLDERVIGSSSLQCPRCQVALDARDGQWVPRNGTSAWGDGFWINHLMVPWLAISDILERQQLYDSVRFRNEVLGLPTNLGDHIITREEIEACCDNHPFAERLEHIPPGNRSRLVAGIDWGGGSQSGTVLVIGYADAHRVFRIVRFDRWQPRTEPDDVLKHIVQRCQQFRVGFIAADGNGNGRVYNRLLLPGLMRGHSLPALYAISYSASGQEPVPEGGLWRWTVSRSGSIGMMFTRIKKGMLRFPAVQASGSFLDEFVCEMAAYDEKQRSIRYLKPDDQQDDALHATNYAELLAQRFPPTF